MRRSTMQVGDKIELKGKTKHGKNRIQQFGSEFWVREIRNSIHTTKHTGVAGPFARVFSPTGDNRWIAIKDDPDFEVLDV